MKTLKLLLRKFVATWRKSPQIRFYARTVAVAVGAYIANTIYSGNAWTLRDLGAGALTAAFTAIVGLFTPLEPHVGVKADIEPPTGR
jgi:hypothetical protein